MELEKFDADIIFPIASKVVWNPRTNTLVHLKDAKKIDPCTDPFKRYNEASLKTVMQNVWLYKETEQEWHPENLNWSTTKVLNSCEDILWAEIVEDTAPIPSHWQTGPVMSKLMDDGANHVCISKSCQIESTPKVFDGENFRKMASWIWGATRFLKAKWCNSTWQN